MAVEFYRYSYRTAEHDGDVEEYRASRDENRRCTEFIQNPQTGLYANAYKDNVVDKDGTYLDKCISEFGMQRMMFVIANTVKMSKHDGRWSPEVKEWAKDFMTSHTSEYADGYLSQIHTGVVNILAEKIIKKYNGLNLFSREHCLDNNVDMQGKVIVLNHMSMKEEYWKPEYQLWLATGGFGCSPTASGRAVYATCLYDGEHSRWNREKVLGVLKNDYLPDWAREKLEELQNTGPEEEQTGGINLN